MGVMRLLEYQGKELLGAVGLPVPAYRVVDSVAGALEAAQEIGYPVVLKAQVLVGGRGKAGGVKVVSGPGEARREAERILGMEIRGYPVRQLMVTRAVEVEKEYYAAFLLDRSARSYLLLFSTRGGVDIEEVARETPEAVARVGIPVHLGLQDFHLRRIFYRLKVPREEQASLREILRGMYRVLVEKDADLVEVNPLAREGERFWVLDAKVTLDENAFFRHPEFGELVEEDESLHPLEREARRRGIAYVRLEGDIAVVGNGAGLVMTTMDSVREAGGQPACFLDLRGGASEAQMREALRFLFQDERLRVVFLNIFGGITRCDEVARALLRVLEELKPSLPIVARIAGTRAEEARRLLEGSPIEAVETMEEGARRAVALRGSG